MWNTLAAVLAEPVSGFGDGGLFFTGFRFVVERCVSQCGRYRIDNRFQQSNQCQELFFRQTVYQLVGVLAFAHRVFSSAAEAAMAANHLRFVEGYPINLYLILRLPHMDLDGSHSNPRISTT